MSPLTVDPKWVNSSSNSEAVRRLVDTLDCSHALASVLATRGVTDTERAARWLSPSTEAVHDPGALRDLEDRTRPGERPET